MNNDNSGEESNPSHPNESSVSTPHIPRKERERNRHRSEVLSATERLLISRHYQDVGVKDIASEAEFSVGYLYKLFPNKEEIILSIIHRKMEDRLDIIRASVSMRLPFPDRFKHLIQSLERWQQKNMVFHPSSVGAALDLISDSPEARERHTRHEEAARTMLHSFFEEAIGTGFLHAEDPAMITDSFEAAMKGFVINNMRPCVHVSKGSGEWKEFGSTLETLILRAFDPSWRTERGGSNAHV